MKKVVSIIPKNTIINLIDIDIWKTHIFTKDDSIYKLICLKNEIFSCGFVDITRGSACKAIFISGSFKDSIQMALDSGQEVFQLDDSYELLDLLTNHLQSI